ncbi:ROK family protein [Qipengyuania marincola]|uniref:ROK family protein n=1 Tax=Qipengyuania sp. XHP0207 TaxID=3038078 RepID=UPI00406932D8
MRGPAILERWGSTLSDLPANHEARDLVAGYLAQMCHSISASMATEIIVLGGGVMKTPGLLEKVVDRAQNISPAERTTKSCLPRLEARLA